MAGRKYLSFIPILGIVGAVLFVSGVVSADFVRRTLESVEVRLIRMLASPEQNTWGEAFELVSMPSTIDGSGQKAYWHGSTGAELRPLLVSLHTWSGDFNQRDPLAASAAAANWNYLHPDFRGPNNRPESGLSNLVLADIDDAIQFALDFGSVDPGRIFVVGESGGGHAALGAWLRSRHPIHTVLAWVPITDLEAWYWQCRARGLKCAVDILKVVGGEASDADWEEARNRSPLYMPILEGRALPGLELYAGIRDGYGNQSVPISHSLLFFNRLADHFGETGSVVDTEQTIRLLSRGVARIETGKQIGGRAVWFERRLPGVRFSIFDGGHEMLNGYCFDRLETLAETGNELVR